MNHSSILHFGGSFNPIHHGHLICARAVAEKTGFGRIILVPSAQPPHKPHDDALAPAHHRLEMCRLAAQSAQGPPFFEVDDIELHRPGPSYTLDTARALKNRGLNTVHWLIGADMLQFLPKWHQPETLLDEVEFVIMARPGWTFDWSILPPKFRRLQSALVEAPLIDISATDIRNRIKAGRSIDFLTPAPVCEYIRRHALFT